MGGSRAPIWTRRTAVPVSRAGGHGQGKAVRILRGGGTDGHHPGISGQTAAGELGWNGHTGEGVVHERRRPAVSRRRGTAFTRVRDGDMVRMLRQTEGRPSPE